MTHSPWILDQRTGKAYVARRRDGAVGEVLCRYRGGAPAGGLRYRVRWLSSGKSSLIKISGLRRPTAEELRFYGIRPKGDDG